MTQSVTPLPEIHPLEPFLPDGARLLMLGSFPPARERWSMDFYYPNPQNDMWRIIGLVFFGDKDHFSDPHGKGFLKHSIVYFLTRSGIALSDTAKVVIRERGNASDKHLKIVEPVEIGSMLEKIPLCRTVVTTGEHAASTLARLTDSAVPSVGKCESFSINGRQVNHYRMPSSSRAYPLSLAKKAQVYKAMFREAGLEVYEFDIDK